MVCWSQGVWSWSRTCVHHWRARPSVASLFWIVAANGTTLTDADTDNPHYRARLIHVRVHCYSLAFDLETETEIETEPSKTEIKNKILVSTLV